MARVINRAKTHFLKHDNLSSILEPAAAGEAAFTASKVIVTIGPACQDVETLCSLLEAGATCARCDLTWGPLDFHKQSLANLQTAMRKTRKLCAIMIDTVGREILINREAKLDTRGWPVHEHALGVKANDRVIITTRNMGGGSINDGFLPVSYPKFPSMCERGDTIFLGRYLVTGSEDTSVYLTVEEVSNTDVKCVARNNAVLEGLMTVFHTERSANSLANTQNDLPALNMEDKIALKELARDFEIDFVSLSFTRHASDIEETREFLTSIGLEGTKVLAKCETRQALFEFQGIAQAADGIILSRGNLGLDVLPEKMALIQKAVISNSNLMGKPVLVTRVVDTMIQAPRPTRAEATDVANAVLDGADGILLGAETVRGRHPVATVETILHICKQAERCFDHKHHFEHLMAEAIEQMNLRVSSSEDNLARATSDGNLPQVLGHATSFGAEEGSDLGRSGIGRSVPYMDKLESLASSAVRAADKVGAKLIIVFTQSGTTASLVSKYRPPVPILTLVVPTLKCSDGLKWTLEGRANARQCLIYNGLLPVLAAPSPSGETLLSEAVAMCIKSGMVKPSDHIVVVQKVHDAFMIKIVSVDTEGLGIASIRPQSLIDLMKNAHAAAEGNMDEESQAAIEAHIKQQLNSGTGGAGSANLVPVGNFSRQEAPRQEPNLQTSRPHMHQQAKCATRQLSPASEGLGDVQVDQYGSPQGEGQTEEPSSAALGDLALTFTKASQQRWGRPGVQSPDALYNLAQEPAREQPRSQAALMRQSVDNLGAAESSVRGWNSKSSSWLPFRLSKLHFGRKDSYKARATPSLQDPDLPTDGGPAQFVPSRQPSSRSVQQSGQDGGPTFLTPVGGLRQASSRQPGRENQGSWGPGEQAWQSEAFLTSPLPGGRAAGSAPREHDQHWDPLLASISGQTRPQEAWQQPPAPPRPKSPQPLHRAEARASPFRAASGPQQRAAETEWGALFRDQPAGRSVHQARVPEPADYSQSLLNDVQEVLSKSHPTSLEDARSVLGQYSQAEVEGQQKAGQAGRPGQSYHKPTRFSQFTPPEAAAQPLERERGPGPLTPDRRDSRYSTRNNLSSGDTGLTSSSEAAPEQHSSLQRQQVPQSGYQAAAHPEARKAAWQRYQPAMEPHLEQPDPQVLYESQRQAAQPPQKQAPPPPAQQQAHRQQQYQPQRQGQWDEYGQAPQYVVEPHKERAPRQPAANGRGPQYDQAPPPTEAPPPYGTYKQQQRDPAAYVAHKPAVAEQLRHVESSPRYLQEQPGSPGYGPDPGYGGQAVRGEQDAPLQRFNHLKPPHHPAPPRQHALSAPRRARQAYTNEYNPRPIDRSYSATNLAPLNVEPQDVDLGWQSQPTTPRGTHLRGPVQQSLPPNFSEHLPSGRKRIARVVGGRVVPGIVSAAGRLPPGHRWTPQDQVIPEYQEPVRGARYHDENAWQNGVRESPLRGPVSVSMPAEYTQRQTNEIAPAKPVRRTREGREEVYRPRVREERRQHRRGPRGAPPASIPENDMERADSNASSYLSNLDEQDQYAEAPPPHAAAGRGVPRAALPRAAGGIPAAAGPEAGRNRLGFPHGVSRSTPQPRRAAEEPASRGSYERLTVKQQMYNPGIMATSPDLRHVGPDKDAGAEEMMKSYLIGEGIKKAQLRALHSRQPVKKKKGFFRSLFS